MASPVVLPAHLLPLAQVILQQVSDLRAGVAVTVAILMTHGVAVPIGAIVAAVAVVMRHRYSSGVILAVMAGRKKTIAMVPEAALQLAAIFLVVRGDIVGSSAGLDFIVQLRNGNRSKHEHQKLFTQQTHLIISQIVAQTDLYL